MPNDAHFDIRDSRPEDAPAIQAIYAPFVTDTAISFETDIPDVAEMARRIDEFQKAHVCISAVRDGDVIGYAYSSPHRARASYRSSVDVTVYIAEAARGAGVGKALYQELLKRTAALGYHAAFAGITLPNPGSVGLHESVGFTQVGVYREVGFKLGAWRDVGWWQRLLTDEG